MVQIARRAFATSRLLDFFSEKELTAQTGHAAKDWPLVVVKELFDNALDACEEARVAPDIELTVENDSITVADNGPGIPAEVVQRILDYTVRVSSREAYVSPDRGAQGNALKTLVAMPFVLSGTTGRVEMTARGIRHEIEVTVDRIRQQPHIAHRQFEDADVKSGTSVRVEWPDPPRSEDDDEDAEFLQNDPDSPGLILTRARDRFLQLADDYTYLNPHLALSVRCGDEPIKTTSATEPGWSKWRPSDPTSAHWYKPEHLERLIAAYLSDDADHGRERSVREFIAEFRGLTGSAKQKAVLAQTGLSRSPLAALVDGDEIDHELVRRLLDAMREHSKPVNPAALGVIGKENLRRRFEELGCEMETFDYRKVADTSDDLPYIVETAFAWRPESSSRRLMTGVNWSPGILNPFRDLGRMGVSLDTILERQRASRNEPIVFLIHLVCPRVEYADRGKSSVIVRD